MERRLIISALAITAAWSGVALPAHAQTGIAAAPGSMSLVNTVAQGCGTPIQPAAGQLANAPNPSFVSKSAALLGGQPSRLEQMARQQSLVGGAELLRSPDLSASPPSGNAIRSDCLGRPGLSSQSAYIASIHSADGNNFLASKRLSVKRTSFDANWGRVQRASLSASQVSSLIAAPASASDHAKLATVNSWANSHIRYVEDRQLYGKADYWASANTTLRNSAGDCEDIAITKMHMLAAMGVPSTDMYLTIARDLVRNADHAVLIVKIEGKHWMLDNATDQVLDASEGHDYRPIFSFSSNQKWVHGY